MQEIKKLREQAETEAQNAPAETPDTPEAQKYSHKGSGFAGWFEYFREYYKWPALIIGVIVIALFIGFHQLAEKSDPDLSMMYVGPGYLTFDDQEKLKDAAAGLTGSLHGDYNEDGRYVVNFLDLTLVYAQNAEGYQIMTKDDQDTTFTRFQSELRAGDTLLYFLDPFYYEIIKREGILQPLAAVLDDASVSFDGYGIHIGDLDAKELPGFERMPSRTVVCLRQSPTEDAISYGRTESQWAHHRDLLQCLVAYRGETPDAPTGTPDTTLYYVGTNEAYRDKRLPMEEKLSSMTADLNGDGNKLFRLMTVLRTGTDARKAVIAKQVRTELRTGQSNLFLLDKEAFEYAKEHGLLEPLPAKYRGSEAETDGFGLKLNKLPLREAVGFYELDPDAVLCLRKNPADTAETYGRSDEKWQNDREIFAKLADYRK